MNGNKASAKQVGGNHYNVMKIQPYLFCFRNGFNNLQSEAISYISRYNLKWADNKEKQIEDLQKAIHTIELLIDEIEEVDGSLNSEQRCSISNNSDLDKRLLQVCESEDCPPAALKEVEFLIEAGADVDAKAWDGCTPLHLSSWAGNLEIARLLINKGASVDEPCAYGWRPLHVAIRLNNKQLVSLLLDNGADVNLLSTDDESPLDFAEMHNVEASIIELLRERGAMPSPPRSDCEDDSVAIVDIEVLSDD